MKNSIEFKVYGREAMFTDPVSRIGGEKCSYHIPTYEALKGIVKSIYWKPTFIWVIDKVRVMKPIKTKTKCLKPLKYHEKGNSLAIYNYLYDVEYQVVAHFEWNLHRPELAQDRIDGKHYSVALRALEKGGRQDIFLGTRECQGYVEPCQFEKGMGEYDNISELAFGFTFHGFDYPDETGQEMFRSRYWNPKMVNGIISFIRPEQCEIIKPLHKMNAKPFGIDTNQCSIIKEEEVWQ
jgi:CRISPR-associated protein Cas5d